MNEPQPKATLSTRAKAIGGTVLLGGAVLVYYLLTGGLLGNKDFTGQDLRDQGTRFHRQDMVKSTFVDANVSGLDMVGVQLHNANMERVIAEQTNLYQAVFARANLRNANLRGANLVEASFANADLTGANLSGADIRGATFYGANLTGADLRDTHTGASCVDRSTNASDARCPEPGADDPCCPQSFDQARIDSVKICRNPWASLLREFADNTEGFGFTGEPVYFENNTNEGGTTYCTEAVWEGGDQGGWQDRQFNQGRGGLIDLNLDQLNPFRSNP